MTWERSECGIEYEGRVEVSSDSFLVFKFLFKNFLIKQYVLLWNIEKGRQK